MSDERSLRMARRLVVQEQSKTVSRLVDGLQHAVDHGIRRTVVALRVHGFNTTASCMGHPARGACHPWVRVEARLHPGRLFRDVPHAHYCALRFHHQEAIYSAVAAEHGLSVEDLMHRDNLDRHQEVLDKAFERALEQGQTPGWSRFLRDSDGLHGDAKRLLRQYHHNRFVEAPDRIELDFAAFNVFFQTSPPYSKEALPQARKAMNQFARYLLERFIATGPFLTV